MLEGRWCRVEPLDPGRHAEQLFAANTLDREGRMWAYLSYGPFETLAKYREWIAVRAAGDDPLFFAFVDPTTGQATGLGSYLRIEPDSGSIEVGHLQFSPLLQRTPAATEAMYLMMRNAFELGYRRYEWKCDSLNERSRRAAERLGFTFEGVFRQATVYRGRNRDTAWYSIIDSEWPALKEGFLVWLDHRNFDEARRQRRTLAECRQDRAGA
jgi:RimJ/RimL family protein N-acetyltransferase